MCIRDRCLPPYQVASWSMQPFGRNIFAENWGLCPCRGGELGPHLTQCGHGRGLPKLPACKVSSWSVQPFGHSTPTSQTDRTDRQRPGSIGRPRMADKTVYVSLIMCRTHPQFYTEKFAKFCGSFCQVLWLNVWKLLKFCYIPLVSKLGYLLFKY